MKLRALTMATAAVLASLTACTNHASPGAGSFALQPVADRATELALQSGIGPAVPAFADAFGGYVGSLAAVGPLATFEQPSAIAFLPDGTLYVADGPCIRRIAPDVQGRQTVSTVAGDWQQTGSVDGPVAQARFEGIGAMLGMPDGSLIVADGARLRRIVFDGHGGGHVSTLAGTADMGDADGVGTAARFYPITSLALVGGGRLFAAEANRIRQIDLDTATGQAVVSTFYADGVFDPEAYDSPYLEQVAATPDGAVWAAGNGSVRRLRRGPDEKGVPDLTVLGTEPSERPGEASWGPFGSVRGLATLPSGDLAVVAVNGSYAIRKISVDGDGLPHVSLLARSLPFKGGVRFGSWLDMGLSSPHQLAVGPHGEIRVLDQTAVRAIDVDADGMGTPSTFAGWPLQLKRQDGPAAATSLHPTAIVSNGRGGYYMAVWNALWEMEPTAMGGATTRFLAGIRELGKADGVGDQARFDTPNALLVYPDGSLIVNDYQNHLIRRVTFDADRKATVSTLAGGGAFNGSVKSLTLGDGPALSASVLPNHELCLGPDGAIYFGDRYRVRKLARDTSGQWRVTSIAGRSNLGIEYKDGPGEQARFGNIGGLAFDQEGALIVADTDNHLIRRLVFDAAGAVTVSTIAGKATGTHLWNTGAGYKDGPAAEAQFKSPNDVEIAEDGSLLVTDFGNHAIRRIAKDATGAWQVSTLIGAGDGMQDGPFSLARLSYPIDLEPDGPGRYVCLDGRFPTYQIRTIRLGANP